MSKQELNIGTDKEFINFPNEVYGRREVIDFFNAKLEQCDKGQTTTIICSGKAGIGKSFLIRNFFDREDVVYVRGKYNQYKKSVPFQAWVQFVENGLSYLESLSEDKKEEFRNGLRAVLQNDEYPISRLIPKLGMWLDLKQTVPSEFDSTLQIQNRWYAALYGIIDLFAQFVNSKIIVHLDDIQWSDDESLELVEKIIDRPIDKVCLILSQRTAEGENNEDKIAHLKTTENHIEITPFNLEDCQHLMKDLFDFEAATVEETAQLLIENSDGNPLLIKENLSQFILKEILQYDLNEGKWYWNREGTVIEENEKSLQEITESKIKDLDGNTREILERTACFGYKISVPFVSAITGVEKEQLVAAFEAACAAGIMRQVQESLSRNPEKELAYMFANDTAQAALQAVIPEKTKVKTHQQIAQYYINSAATGLDDRDVYECAYHLNECIQDESNDLIKNQHLEVNILALEKAKKSASFSVAMNYLNQAMDSDLHYNWKSGYQNAAKLRIQGYEVARLTDRGSLANRFYNELLEKGKREEILKIQFSKVMLDVQFGKLEDSLNTGITAMRTLGVKLPKKAGVFHVLQELIRTRIMLIGKKAADFFNLPTMEDADGERIIQFSRWMLKSAYYIRPELSAIISLKMVQLTWKKGTSADSFTGMMAYGIISAAGTNNYQKAHEWCEVGDKLAAKHGNHSSTYYFGKGVYGAFTQHLPETLPWYTIAIETGYEEGDFISSVEPTVNQSLTIYSSGEKLDVLIAKVNQSLMYCDSLRIKDYRDFQFTFLLQLKKLRGDQVSNEEQKEANEILHKTQYHFSRDVYYFMELQRFCFEGRWKDAYDLSRSNKINVQAFTGLYVQAEYHFYMAIAALMNPDNQKFWNKIRNYFLIRGVLSKMKKWAAACEDNHEHKRQIVIGLNYLRRKKIADAQQALMKGADLAIQKGFVQNAALANYFIAEIYSEQNEEKNAQTFRKKSIRQFKDWGTTLMN